MRIYNPSTADDWKVRVAAHAHAAIAKPMQGSVRVAMWFEMRRPASHRTAAGAVRPTAPTSHQQKPDVDNLAKAVLDALNGIAFADDSQVGELIVGKRWADGEPRCILTLEEIRAA